MSETGGMERGYFRLWRKLDESEVFQDPHLLRLFVWCLIRASYDDRNVSIKRGRGAVVLALGPGQFIFGKKTASEKLGTPATTLLRRMKKLESLGMLEIDPGNKFCSVVTVANWQDYQADLQPGKTKSGNAVKQLRNDLHSTLVRLIAEKGLEQYRDDICIFFDYRMEQKVKKRRFASEKGLLQLLKCVRRCEEEGMKPEVCMQIASDNEWLIPQPSYFRRKDHPEAFTNIPGNIDNNNRPGQTTISGERENEALELRRNGTITRGNWAGYT